MPKQLKPHKPPPVRLLAPEERGQQKAGRVVEQVVVEGQERMEEQEQEGKTPIVPHQVKDPRRKKTDRE